MKIVFILISSLIGGAEKMYSHLFMYLAQKGKYDYHLIINKQLYDLLINCGYEFYKIRDKITVIGLPMLERDIKAEKSAVYKIDYILSFLNMLRVRLANLYYFFQTPRLLKMLRPDVVHGILNGVYHVFLVKSVRRIVSYMDSCYLFVDKRPVVKNIMKHVDAIDILHEGLEEGLSKRKIIRGQKLYVADRNFVDYSTLICEKKRVKRVVFSSRIEESKGIYELIEIMTILSKSKVHFDFLIMGVGSLDLYLSKKVNALNDKRFRYIGFHPKPNEILKDSLVFLSIQRENNFSSQSLLEAMASGCAIVATDKGETYKIVDELVGFRVPLDPEIISNKIIWILNNPNKAQDMGLKARMRVLSHYTVEWYANYIETAYDELVTMR